MTREVRVTFRPQLKDLMYAAQLEEREAWKTTRRVVAGLLLISGVGFFEAGFRAWALPWIALAAVTTAANLEAAGGILQTAVKPR